MRIVPLALLLAPFAAAAAQSETGSIVPRAAPALCHGEMVTSMEIITHPPGATRVADAWKEVSSFAGMHHTPMKEWLIKAYLRVGAGQRCTELNRSESERLLRAQRFIASATVRPVPDGPGQVKIVVETVDDLGVILGGSFRGASLQSLLVGNENINGQGLTVELSGERGFRYRSGFGGDVVQYGAFGKPFTLAVGGEVHPQGDALRFEFSKPFLTELQPNGFHIGATEVNSYYDLTRPTGDDVFLNVRRVAYDVGLGTRVGKLSRDGAIGVIGALITGESVNVATHAVFMTDSGLFATPPLSEVDNKYSELSVVRVGGFAGLRALKFLPVHGFDAVAATQDVAKGVQLGLFAGPSVWASRNRSDYFVSGELYAGFGTAASFLEVRLTGEGRADRQSQRWDGIVAFGKLAWYMKPSDDETRSATIEFSRVQHLAFPLQLSFFDHLGGLPGFQNSSAVGGHRGILRLEERRVVPIITKRADWAIAAFADAGKIWAGDVPFGRTSALRGSLGISLLTAYPAGGKRIYRVDFAVPVNPDGSRFEIRFSSSDETRSIWRQPNDIAAARSNAALGNLGSWAPR